MHVPRKEHKTDPTEAMAVKQIAEYNDNKKYPPIKEARDPFSEWF